MPASEALVQVLRTDKRAIFTAASQSQKAIERSICWRPKHPFFIKLQITPQECFLPGSAIGLPTGFSPMPVPRHFLVADDFPDSADVIATLIPLLCADPVTVDVALDGRQAIVKATAHPPDVALLDIDMPYATGVEVAQALIAALHPAPRMIAVTGNVMNIPSLTAMGLFEQVLAKPLSGKTLAALVCG